MICGHTLRFRRAMWGCWRMDETTNSSQISNQLRAALNDAVAELAKVRAELDYARDEAAAFLADSTKAGRGLLIPALATALYACGSSAETTVNVPETRNAAIEWKDPDTGAPWFHSAVKVTWQDARDACGQTFQLPRTEDLRIARSRGICAGRTDTEACGKTWSTSVVRDSALTFDMESAVSAVTLKTELAQTFCISR